MASTNPFEHHHPRYDDRDAAAEPLDPAQQSLADALRVSFLILKGVMFIAVAAYLVTGTFTVESREVAARLRFGKIVGRGSDQIITKGVHFALPYPFEQVVKIDISPRSIELPTQFYFQVSERDAGRTLDEMRPRPLNPENDGSLLTGDANVVHAKWTVNYRVRRRLDDTLDYDAVVDFLGNIGDADRGDEVVRNAAEQGIVAAVAQMTADDLIKGRNYERVAKSNAQRALDTMRSGLEITQISIKDPTVPLSVREAFFDVIKAENERGLRMNEAQQQRATILGAAAGEAHTALWQMFQAYERAGQAQDTRRAVELLATIDLALIDLNTGPEYGGIPIGGEAAGIINAAKAYRTQIVEEIKGEADRFTSLLEQYNQNPRIVINRKWQGALERILTGDVETLYLPAGQIWIDLNRDPNVARQRELQRLEAEAAEQGPPSR